MLKRETIKEVSKEEIKDEQYEENEGANKQINTLNIHPQKTGSQQH
jgi:hypothetical protein